jgi:hypothetical protein
MVEARSLEAALEKRAPMRDEGGIEKREVRRIGEHAAVQDRVVRKRRRGAHPQIEHGLARRMREVALIFDGVQLDRALALEIPAHRIRHRRHDAVLDFRFARQLLGVWHLGHREAVGKPLLLHVEGDRHGEDRMPVLDRPYAARREAPAVAQLLDLVDDGNSGIAGQDEIGMQRMRHAPLDGAASRDEGLADDLPAEDALPPHLRASASKQVDLEGLEIKDADEIANGIAHLRRISSHCSRKLEGPACQSQLAKVNLPRRNTQGKPFRRIGPFGAHTSRAAKKRACASENSGEDGEGRSEDARIGTTIGLSSFLSKKRSSAGAHAASRKKHSPVNRACRRRGHVDGAAARARRRDHRGRRHHRARGGRRLAFGAWH